MKFAQPLRETLRGRAPNLAGMCSQGVGTRQRISINSASLSELFYSSHDHLPGETIISRLSGSFPLICTSFVHEKTIARPYSLWREK